MSETTRRIVLVSGGLSEESATNRLGEAIVSAMQEQATTRQVTLDVTRVYVRDMAADIASASLSGFATGALADAHQALADADGVIALTPTFKASYTGLFKGFWDVTTDGLIADVPTLLGATGGSARHSLMTDTAMRPLFAYLGARTMPTSIFAATDDWADASLQRRIERAADELLTTVLAANPSQGAAVRSDDAAADAGEPAPASVLGRRRQQASDPFANAPTTEQLLGGLP